MTTEELVIVVGFVVLGLILVAGLLNSHYTWRRCMFCKGKDPDRKAHGYYFPGGFHIACLKSHLREESLPHRDLALWQMVRAVADDLVWRQLEAEQRMRDQQMLLGFLSEKKVGTTPSQSAAGK